MKKLHRIFVLPSLLLLMIGCGGKTPPESSPAIDVQTPALEDAAPTPPPAASPRAAPEDETQAKPASEGMMLPDDLPLPDATPATDPSKSDDSKTKGMQLPESLQPSRL